MNLENTTMTYSSRDTQVFVIQKKNDDGKIIHDECGEKLPLAVMNPETRVKLKSLNNETIKFIANTWYEQAEIIKHF